MAQNLHVLGHENLRASLFRGGHFHCSNIADRWVFSDWFCKFFSFFTSLFNEWVAFFVFTLIVPELRNCVFSLFLFLRWVCFCTHCLPIVPFWGTYFLKWLSGFGLLQFLFLSSDKKHLAWYGVRIFKLLLLHVKIMDSLLYTAWWLLIFLLFFFSWVHFVFVTWRFAIALALRGL